MNAVLCEGTWTSSNGTPVCSGTLVSVAQTELIPSGMTTEDAVELSYQAIGLFAVIFAALALKKALS